METNEKTTKQVTQHCVFALCRNMTVHYKVIEYKKDDGPWKVMFLTNVTIVATIVTGCTTNTLTEEDNDCTMSNPQIQPGQGNSSGWIAPNFDVKMDASNSEAENTHLDSGNANGKLGIQPPVSQMNSTL